MDDKNMSNLKKKQHSDSPKSLCASSFRKKKRSLSR